MKKLIVFLTIVTLNLTAFSQTGTDIDHVKTFPVPVVKLIVKDLLSGDSAKAQLKLTEEQLYHTENKLILKDSIINTMKLKELNYQNIINAHTEKYSVLENYSKKLEFDLKKEKVKGKFKSVLGTGFIAVLTFLLITK